LSQCFLCFHIFSPVFTLYHFILQTFTYKFSKNEPSENFFGKQISRRASTPSFVLVIPRISEMLANEAKRRDMIKPDHNSVLDLPLPGGTGHHVDWQTLAHRAQFKPGKIALLCGVSSRTVQRHFRQSYGCTLGQWLRDYRLGIAYQRLNAGESIKFVALELGYKQLSHFSRDFKRQYGCAPRFLDHNGAP
jgi:AraC-like DNA-binding protein